jgi:hypothetical protein
VVLAAEVADATPKYGERAFDKLLDFLLREGSTNGSFAAPRKMSRGQRGSRKPPKVDTASMERVRAILEAPPELAADYSDLRDLDAKAKVYTILSVAREKFGIDGLTTPEIRGIAKDKFRVGIADGTLTSILSKAPATEIGRTSGKGKETVYKLLQAGDLYLENAKAKLASRKSKEGPPTK